MSINALPTSQTKRRIIAADADDWRIVAFRADGRVWQISPIWMTLLRIGGSTLLGSKRVVRAWYARCL